MLCNNCGQQIDPKEAFCFQCGKTISLVHKRLLERPKAGTYGKLVLDTNGTVNP